MNLSESSTLTANCLTKKCRVRGPPTTAIASATPRLNQNEKTAQVNRIKVPPDAKLGEVIEAATCVR